MLSLVVSHLGVSQSIVCHSIIVQQVFLAQGSVVGITHCGVHDIIKFDHLMLWLCHKLAMADRMSRHLNGVYFKVLDYGMLRILPVVLLGGGA